MGHGLAGGPSETVSAHNGTGSHNEVGPPGIVRTNRPWFTQPHGALDLDDVRQVRGLVSGDALECLAHLVYRAPERLGLPSEEEALKGLVSTPQ